MCSTKRRQPTAAEQAANTVTSAGQAQQLHCMKLGLGAVSKDRPVGACRPCPPSPLALHTMSANVSVTVTSTVSSNTNATARSHVSILCYTNPHNLDPCASIKRGIPERRLLLIHRLQLQDSRDETRRHCALASMSATATVGLTAGIHEQPEGVLIPHRGRQHSDAVLPVAFGQQNTDRGDEKRHNVRVVNYVCGDHVAPPSIHGREDGGPCPWALGRREGGMGPV